MANKPLDTSLLDRALVFAVRAHAGTERRGKGFPYIVHPLEAVEIVATMTRDQGVVGDWYLTSSNVYDSETIGITYLKSSHCLAVIRAYAYV